MDKIKKVIKGLECCDNDDCDNCPYFRSDDENDLGTCKATLHRDAIALLKVQEPVKPIENAVFYYCGACRYAFTSARQKYCSECGKPVKWE